MMDENDRQIFFTEVRHTIERCLHNQFPITNAIMEVKSLKMSYNMDYSDCLEAFIPPLFDTIKEENRGERAKLIQKTLTEWKQFLTEFVKGEKEEQSFV